MPPLVPEVASPAGHHFASVASQATMFRRELNLPETLEIGKEVATVYARQVNQKAKGHAQDQLKQLWDSEDNQRTNTQNE